MNVIKDVVVTFSRPVYMVSAFHTRLWAMVSDLWARLLRGYTSPDLKLRGAFLSPSIFSHVN